MAVRDVIVVTVLLFAFAVGFLFFNKIGHSMTANIMNVTAINNTIEAKTVLQSADNALNKQDYIYFGIFIGFFLLNIILAWIVGGLPLFAGIYFLMTIVFVILSTILKAIWIELSTKATFTATLALMPITNHIMTNLPMYTAIIGLISLTVMFAKPYIAVDIQQ